MEREGESDGVELNDEEIYSGGGRQITDWC